MPTKLILALVGLVASAVLTTCAPNGYSAGSQRVKNPEGVDLQQILVLLRPPKIAIENIGDMTTAERILGRLDPNELAGREGARMIDANALPWLTGSTEGRAFLSTRDRRVLIRGTPSTSCPVALTKTGSAPIPQLASEGLRQCMAESAPGCGCQVVAAGSVLLVPREEVAYATGISARIRAPSLGLDGILVAEETPDGSILLRDVSGVVGKMERNGAGDVSLVMNNAIEPFSGTARRVGFRRGRLAERIYAKDSSGNRVSLLIGFPPEELAQIAGAWLAWPPDA